MHQFLWDTETLSKTTNAAMSQKPMLLLLKENCYRFAKHNVTGDCMRCLLSLCPAEAALFSSATVKHSWTAMYVCVFV